jgi:hypothetical protein
MRRGTKEERLKIEVLESTNTEYLGTPKKLVGSPCVDEV